MFSSMVEVYLFIVREGEKYVYSGFSKLSIRTDNFRFSDVW